MFSVRGAVCIAAVSAATGLFAISATQGHASLGSPGPPVSGTGEVAGILDIAILVLREGLECVLVLAAITAGFTSEQQRNRYSVAIGAGVGLVVTFATWCFAVRILDDISGVVSALQLQAATGLLAVIVLLVVMNWFFHKIYWTGWISLHNSWKRILLEESKSKRDRNLRIGLGLLGFSSVYREGVEVVLFLQGHRLRLGNEPIYFGVLLGAAFSGVVAILTFIAHRKLPYKECSF